MRIKATFGLLMISLVLIQAQTGYFGEIGFDFQYFYGADTNTHIDVLDHLSNFVYSQTVEGRAMTKVWDMTMSNNGAMFLAQDAYLNCYIGSMNLTSNGAVALQKIEDNCIMSLLITDIGNVFVLFQDGSAGLSSYDYYTGPAWLIAPPAGEFDFDSTSKVTLLSDSRDSLWVLGNGFIASYSSDGGTQSFKRQNFTIEGYSDYEIQAAIMFSLESILLIATAGDGASATSLIIIIKTADLDWTVRASAIEGNVALNDLNLYYFDDKFTTTGSYTENGQTYFLSASVDTKSLEISKASRSEQPIDGPLSGKTYHLYGADSDDVETWLVLETYSLAGNKLIYQRGSTLTQRTISSTGCYTFIPTNLAGWGSPERSVLIGGYLSGSGDGPLVFMSWDTDSSLEGVFTVGDEESLSTIGINLESVTAEVTSPLAGWLTASPQKVMATNVVISAVNNNISRVEITSPISQYTPMPTVTFDDGTFNYPLSDLAITIQSPDDVDYNTDTHEMTLSSEATGKVTVAYSVKYGVTYVCMSSSLVLSNHSENDDDDDQNSSSESDDADVDANHSDDDEDDQDSSESDDADVDANHSDEDDDDQDSSSESDDADVDANHSDDQDSSESDDADVDVNHSDDDDDRDSSESGDADIDANHSDEDDDDQDSSESDDADVDANHESHSDDDDQDSSSESDSSSGDSSSGDKSPVHPSGAPGTGHESASSATSLNGFFAALFVALVAAL